MPLSKLVGIRLRELRREDWRGVVLQVFSQQFSVAQASAGVRSRLAGIGVQKTKRTQARLWKFSFFESHIRATNAPARRISIMTILLIMSKNSVLSRYSRSVDSQDLPTCSSFGVALRQSISTFPEGLDSPFGPTFGCSISRLPRRSIV
ncbi:hypothetical protein EBU02_08490 [bacterium]|nr:hypothetical protein [bacterium]